MKKGVVLKCVILSDTYLFQSFIEKYDPMSDFKKLLEEVSN